MNYDDGAAAADGLIVAALVQRGGLTGAVAWESLRIMAAGDAAMKRALDSSRASALHDEADFLDAYFGIMAQPEP